MPNIEIKDLDEDLTISEDEIKHVKGGLLPATQLTQTYKISTYHKLGVSLDNIIVKI